MAEVIENFPEPVNRGRPKGSKYDKWLDGQVWVLKRGEDFDGVPQRVIRSIRQHANTRRNIGLRATEQDHDTIVVQATDKRQR